MYNFGMIGQIGGSAIAARNCQKVRGIVNDAVAARDGLRNADFDFHALVSFTAEIEAENIALRRALQEAESECLALSKRIARMRQT